MATSSSKRLIGWFAGGLAAYWLGRTFVRRSRRKEFVGRTVLVTGGSRGLGLVLARQLAELGARVAICARDREELQRAEQDLKYYGSRVLALECDVTDQRDVQRAVQTVENRWGPIEVLINNAGVIQVGPAEAMTLDDYDQAMRVHYWGPLHAMLAVLPQMRRQGHGRIVNVASIGGLISVPHLLPYSASKFALVGLSQGMRAELLAEGIYVTTVCPGLMRTGSHLHAQFKGQREAEYAWFAPSASAPLLAMSAERAARQILRACQHGQAHLVLSLPAKLAALLEGVAPGLTADGLSLAERLLPEPAERDQGLAKGHHVRPAWLPAWLTRLGDRAAERNNELVAARPSSEP